MLNSVAVRHRWLTEQHCSSDSCRQKSLAKQYVVLISTLNAPWIDKKMAYGVTVQQDTHVPHQAK